ncbi:MAG: hypothetical protein V3R66_04675 [Rhodospirillales bacterium]
MNAIASIDGAELAGVSNVALASLQVALIQQAQFEETLEEIADRKEEELRVAEDTAESKEAASDDSGSDRAAEESDEETQGNVGGSGDGSVNIEV